jgi:aspartate 1-decarboxylase
MEAVGMLPYEAVEIADVTSGSRLKTYAVEAQRGSKDVIIMGAAAHLVKKDDVIIIFSFADMDLEEAKTHKPSVVALDEENNIIKKIC